MKKDSLAIVAVVLSIGGCTTPYQAPTDPSAAPITFWNDTPLKMSVGIYDGATRCTGRKVLLPLVESGEKRKTTLSTTRDASFSIGQDLNTKSTTTGDTLNIQFIGCEATLTFKPEQGRQYMYRQTIENKKCMYQLFDVSQSQEHPIAVTFKRRNFIRAIDESGPFCTQID